MAKNIFYSFLFFSTQILISFFVSSTALWANASFVVPADSEVLSEIASSQSAPLPVQLKVLTWNVKKGEGKDLWARDFQKLMEGKDLALLQEGLEDEKMPSTLKSIGEFAWHMARSFFMETNRKATGVISGSFRRPHSLSFLRSKGTEPVVRTPKMILFSTYFLENGEPLLAMNIHALNFTEHKHFYQQIDDAAVVLGAWGGKIIAGGDFNTWASSRTQYLLNKMTALGLQQVTFAHDPRELVLDHIFVRGCSVVDATVHVGIKSSDHSPLSTEFACHN